ncbi:TIGR03435 family protein [Acidobacteria bacterium AB60]|nr:TIGR03435 family protein [Acidobacteria bacterium AB60]
MYQSAQWLNFGRVLAVITATACTAAFCQTRQQPAQLEFEVASIRLHASADNKAYVQALQGRLVMQNFSLKQLILFAYDVPNNQVLGVQDWMDSNHFDVQATTAGNPTVKQVEGPMLQALLEERFHLKVHRESMERPVYEITVEKGGPKMQLSKEGSCTPYSMEAPPPVPAPNAPPPIYCDFPHLSGDGTNWTLDGTGVSIRKLATSLSRSGVDRPVIDRTGLAGRFDLHLKWAADAPVSAPASAIQEDPSGPSIFTALKEQLGLRLESAKGPVEVLVIDHAEKPSEN